MNFDPEQHQLEAVFPCNDNRFQQVQALSQELIGISEDLRRELNRKMDALFGSAPPKVPGTGESPLSPSSSPSSASDCWMDEVIEGLRISRDNGNACLERLSSV